MNERRDLQADQLIPIKVKNSKKEKKKEEKGSIQTDVMPVSNILWTRDKENKQELKQKYVREREWEQAEFYWKSRKRF